MLRNKLSNSQPRFLKGLLILSFVLTAASAIVGRTLSLINTKQTCSDWSSCFGSISTAMIDIPKANLLVLLPAMISLILVLVGYLIAEKNYSGYRQLLLPLQIFLAIGAAQMAFYAFMVHKYQGPLISWFEHLFVLLGLSMLCLSFMALYRNPIRNTQLDWQWASTGFARHVLITGLFLLVLLMSGLFLADSPGSGSCSHWPFCLPLALSINEVWQVIAHRLLSLLVIFLILRQALISWNKLRHQVFILSSSTAILVLFLGQVLMGSVLIQKGYPPDLIGLHSSISMGLVVTQSVLVFYTALTPKSNSNQGTISDSIKPLKERIFDFLLLNKPLIVLLLLLTTYAGMVLGAGTLPDAPTVLWTLLGGAFAAGGSSALNQFIDRDLDKKMLRTSGRPLPSGRMTKAEGLALGIGECLLAFFILAGFVNLLAAFLAFLGMVYYVLIYSIWLKHHTVHNTVLGGVAGAIPPLVGWAAATGTLGFPAFILFGIVFLWSPAHFWALALVRKDEYETAGIPMMPVVKGTIQTSRHIFGYTGLLVLVSLLFPVFRITGPMYLSVSLILGSWIMILAWRVYKLGGTGNAWKLYRHSSIYLGVLFLALIIDTVFV